MRDISEEYFKWAKSHDVKIKEIIDKGYKIFIEINKYKDILGITMRYKNILYSSYILPTIQSPNIYWFIFRRQQYFSRISKSEVPQEVKDVLSNYINIVLL